MPLLYSYINAETDPDKLWKIKRRVAKIMRENNDDDRGLAETADMSDDVEDLFVKVNKFKNEITDYTQTLQDQLQLLNSAEQARRVSVERGMVVPQGFDLIISAKVKTLLNNGNAVIIKTNKLDFNKMNIDNINTIRGEVGELEYTGDLLQMVIDLNRNWLDQQAITLQNSIEQALLMLRNVLVSLNLKLSNYRQTTAVLREEGIVGAGYSGGCCCNDVPIEYSPQFQNQMYY